MSLNPNCSVLLYPHECLSNRASTSESNCVECPASQRFIFEESGVPWHSSPAKSTKTFLWTKRDAAADISLHHLAANNRWKRCQQCRRMIELTQGCYHMTCFLEFCYSYNQQACQRAFLDEDCSEGRISYSAQESEQWAWETFNSLPHDNGHVLLRAREVAARADAEIPGGGRFSLGDHYTPYQQQWFSPRCSDSYMDAMKDLNQLPWLQRFVSM